MALEANDEVLIYVEGDSGVVTLDKFNVQAYFAGALVQNESSFISGLDEWYTLTLNTKADRIILQRDSAATSGSLKVTMIPKHALFNYIENVLLSEIQTDINNIASDVDYCKNKVNGKDIIYEYDLSVASTGYYYKNNGQLQADAESKYLEITFDSEANGKEIIISVGTSTQSVDSRYYVVEDENGVIQDTIKNGTIATDYNYKVNIGKVYTGWKLKASWKAVNGAPSITYLIQHISSIEEDVESKYIKYVATTGDDSNDGSAQNPFKSVTAACNSGAETIIVSGGVYDDNLLDLSKCLHDKVTIKGETGKRIIFKKSDSLLVDSGTETLVAGYTKVYSVSCSSPSYGGGANQWLFFDGLDDASQPITQQDALPAQRGKFYRNDCTKIELTTASVLADALDEIEACGENVYKWFYDSGTLYFNRSASTSTYPIYRSYGNYLKTRANQSLVISNVEFRYGVVNLNKVNVGEFYNVASKYVYGDGCFSFVNSISLIFDHCEASSCFKGVNGDGFNGWTDVPSDYFSKCGTTTLRECWAHDNYDDGYSEHRYSEMYVDGGLFEWNGKGGITPSYGSHCVVKNAVTRRNRQNGIYYTGTANDNGNGGQLICFNCLSDKDNRNLGSSFAGFRSNGAGNRVVLIGCKVTNQLNGFCCDSGAYLDLIDCGYAGITRNAIIGSGTITKVKTTIAE
jgi:hypothetical protein